MQLNSRAPHKYVTNSYLWFLLIDKLPTKCTIRPTIELTKANRVSKLIFQFQSSTHISHSTRNAQENHSKVSFSEFQLQAKAVKHTPTAHTTFTSQQNQLVYSHRRSFSCKCADENEFMYTRETKEK